MKSKGLAFIAAIMLVFSAGSIASSRAGKGGGTSQPMGRIRTIGFEMNGIGSSTGEGYLPLGSGNGTISHDTTLFRSGTASARVTTGTTGTTGLDLFLVDNTGATPTTGVTLYGRAYINFDVLPPSGAPTILTFSTGQVTQVAAKLTSAGILQLFDQKTVTQIGSDSVTALVPGQWYRIELSYMYNTGTATMDTELRLDGVTVAAVTGRSSPTGTLASDMQIGFPVSYPGAVINMNIDDVAVNNSTGAAQNSFPGDGRVGLLLPTGDNARGGWVAGGGGTTNLFEAVNNEPPAGLLVGTNTSQIKNTVSSATDNCDLNMQSYLDAGIPPTATIVLVQAVLDQGQQSTTGTKNGAVRIVSNPAQASEDAFVYALNDGIAIGTWPTNWTTAWGTAQVNPSITWATNPVLRVGKRTATTREVDVDFMGIEVEYVDGIPVSSLRGFMDSPNCNTLLRM